MPGEVRFSWGPGNHWEFAHNDIDALLTTRLSSNAPAKSKVIFTIENATEVLRKRKTEKYFNWPETEFTTAFEDLLKEGKSYVDDWDNKKMSNHPEIEDPERQSRARDNFKNDLKAVILVEPQVIKLQSITAKAIARLCVGLRSEKTHQEVGRSLDKLFEKNAQLPEYERHGAITATEVKGLQLYLCLFDNREYDRWMSMSIEDSAFKASLREFEEDLE
ncbi:MAG: hypothetical protein L6R38_005950 [Xanthoria sp. 2 TBL-2021]|nr:MAG: hypothetical protein L6R38_005950 [Xanthoria sp. 2 TBL-2021]